MRRFAVALGFAAVLLSVPPLAAKNHGVQSPHGRRIYEDGEVFSHVRDQSRRTFVVEVVSGLAPEGNLGMLLGLINQPVRGLEYYAGVGLELTPAQNIPFSVRYLFNIDGYRPFVAAGYSYRILAEVGVRSHNVFFEAGYKWVLHRTHHLTAGIGLRRPVSVQVLDDSPIGADDTDPELLAEQIDASRKWVPTLSLRFSRAF